MFHGSLRGARWLLGVGVGQCSSVVTECVPVARSVGGGDDRNDARNAEREGQHEEDPEGHRRCAARLGASMEFEFVVSLLRVQAAPLPRGKGGVGIGPQAGPAGACGAFERAVAVVFGVWEVKDVGPGVALLDQAFVEHGAPAPGDYGDNVALWIAGQWQHANGAFTCESFQSACGCLRTWLVVLRRVDVSQAQAQAAEGGDVGVHPVAVGDVHVPCDEGPWREHVVARGHGGAGVDRGLLASLWLAASPLLAQGQEQHRGECEQGQAGADSGSYRVERFEPW